MHPHLQRIMAVAALSLAAAALSAQGPKTPEAGSAAGGLVRNGSFTDGAAGWEAFGSGKCRMAAESVSGRPALQVSGRVQLGDGPSQDLTQTLSKAAGQYVARLAVRVDKPASVRCLLAVEDETPAPVGPTRVPGANAIILAEKVVRTPGQWVTLEGSARIAWQGKLRSARVYYEVGQIPERVYPDYALADVTVLLDTDGDRLGDVEEARLGTDPARSDTDGDGMPDGYERANGLDPLKNDAAADPDANGFSNLQEYGSATNPRDAKSFPGRPCNPKASPAAGAVLKYLSLLPSSRDGRTVVGQHITNVRPEYDTDVARLYEKTGQWPGLLCLQYEGQLRPIQVNDVNPVAARYWKEGGLVLIKFAVWNPWTVKMANNRPARGQVDYVDIPGLLDPSRSADPARVEANRKAHDVYMDWLEQAAAGLSELQKQGVVVLWRPCSEMNGRWFWWGGRPREHYIALWRHMYDFLTVQKKLDNLLWVYESDSGVHRMIPTDYYYPGDDLVDVMGHNLYNDTWELPFDSEGLYRDYPKVYAFPQAGSGKIRDGSWDNLTFLRTLRSRYGRCSFFAAWNDFDTQGGKVHAVRSIVGNRNADKLMNDPWIITRARLTARIPPPATRIEAE